MVTVCRLVRLLLAFVLSILQFTYPDYPFVSSNSFMPIYLLYTGVFVATDGWGLKQRYKSGKVSILGWTTDDCSKVFSKSFTVVKGDEITSSLPLQGEYDFNNHFVLVQVSYFKEMYIHVTVNMRNQ